MATDSSTVFPLEDGIKSPHLESGGLVTVGQEYVRNDALGVPRCGYVGTWLPLAWHAHLTTPWSPAILL